MFVQTKREFMETDVTPEQEHCYKTALRGNPIETKSLHKYVKIITRRFVSKRLKIEECSVLEQEAFRLYNEGNCTFMTMQHLLGFRQLLQHLYFEDVGHSKLRNSLLGFYSSPEMGRATMTGIMNFHQKLAMLKYLERFCDLTVNPLQNHWK